MGSYGAVAAVPYHAWYGFLNRRFGLWTKTALEVGVAVPLFEIPALTTWTGVFGRNQTLKEAIAQLRKDYSTALAFGTLVWGPASLFTFSFVPPRFHLLTFYSIGAVWDWGISNIIH
ncbi:hypothetical protein CTAYLR_010504 [Chrysophaeum taylorii]|uniref:Uncharacterized protein n=1 Tax=Chrysophaeum taylorii TaxID=2483200 RepID=A0AAD7UK16_9STRA|nr:hypothetical protein CTAYLR_010504 [Chrysophaeum taylorii]